MRGGCEGGYVHVWVCACVCERRGPAGIPINDLTNQVCHYVVARQPLRSADSEYQL